MTRSSRLFLGITAALGLMAGYAAPACATPPAMAAMSAGDVVLLNFSASWCGPCRQMAPLVGEITAAGWIVRHVDADRERDLVRRFAVTGVPCYVLLVKGQEVGRINGATTRGELEQLLAKKPGAAGARGAARFARCRLDGRRPVAGDAGSRGPGHRATRAAAGHSRRHHDGRSPCCRRQSLRCIGDSTTAATAERCAAAGARGGRESSTA